MAESWGSYRTTTLASYAQSFRDQLSGKTSAVRCFFFSSRRRHTRCSRDWSSDVCSSDLVLATVGLVALPSHLVPMDQNVDAVVLLIGLAVGVDYSLFYLKREREERAAGKGARAALEAAAATSGRSVLISGFTVMIAMAGMMFSGDKSYLGFGIATMMVVGIAMLGSLTVLPAMLSKLGDRVDKGKIPYLHRLRRGSGQNRFWKKVLAPAMRRPGIAAAVAGGALLVMALPVLNLHTAQSGLNALPNSAPTVGTIKKISAAFGDGTTSQTEVAIKGNLDSSASQ